MLAYNINFIQDNMRTTNVFYLVLGFEATQVLRLNCNIYIDNLVFNYEILLRLTILDSNSSSTLSNIFLLGLFIYLLAF